MNSQHAKPPNPSLSTQPPTISSLLRLTSQAILQGHQEIEIEHQGMLYRLRCTATGKLILTK